MTNRVADRCSDARQVAQAALDGSVLKPEALPGLLEAACRQAAGSPKARPWVDRLGRAPDEAARLVGDSVADKNRFWEEVRAEASGQAADALGAHLLLMDLAADVASDFLLMMDLHERYERPTLWAGKPMPAKGTPHTQLQNLVVNFTNVTVATRRAVADGMALPGKILFRNLTEIGDTALALVGDHGFFERYLHHGRFSPGEGYGHWKKHLSPKVVRGLIEKLYGRLGLDRGTKAELHRHRVGRYAWLSGFDHVHPAAMLVSARSMGGDPEDPARSTLGGLCDRGLRTLASYVNYFHFEFFALFIGALVKFHGWNLPRSGVTAEELESAASFVHRWETLKSLSVLVQAADDIADERLGRSVAPAARVETRGAQAGASPQIAPKIPRKTACRETE